MKKGFIVFLLLFAPTCFANVELLKNINPNGSSSIFIELASQEMVYFMADDGVHGSELWKTDGTAAGTMLLKDINVGVGSSHLSNFIWDDLEQYFYFTDFANIWQSDGTTGNTIKIYSAENSSQNPMNLFIHGEGLLFSKGELLVSLDLGTGVLTTVSDFSDGDDGTRFFSTVYYQGFTYFNTKGFRRTNGTAQGSGLIFPDTHPANTRPLRPRNFFIYNGLLYFLADDQSNGDANLWQSDGTYEGTHLLKDLNPGSPDSRAINNEAPQFFIYGDRLFFRAYHSSFGYEIWSTDGTESNTLLLKNIYPGSFAGIIPNDGVDKNFTPSVLGDYFYFVGQPGHNLWRSNGTANGTSVFSDLRVSSLMLLGQGLYFSGSLRDPNTGQLPTPQPWLTQGSVESTTLIDETRSNPSQFQQVNGNIIFLANDVENGRELHVVKSEKVTDDFCFPIVTKDSQVVVCL